MKRKEREEKNRPMKAARDLCGMDSLIALAAESKGGMICYFLLIYKEKYSFFEFTQTLLFFF